MKTALAAPSIALALLVTACGPSQTDATLTDDAWTVDSDASQVNYASIKAGDVVEMNSFESVSGTVDEDGSATVEIDLASVSTGVDIRDERMRDIFFVVAENPTATVTAEIDPAAFEALAVGRSTQVALDGTLSVKGVEAPFTADVKVSRTGPDSVVAESAPILINAADLELTEGLETLRGIAGLDSISPTVPVSFTLTFTR